eukprot:CAMPEP_0173079514 /NCGR_PEP_ID=MMETSP1102-20130122/15207_1 /TAXON_ID=49646 /ORGANISM="Geminigera sp., Strain Caron Lab Isolate" /LENGTH=215 /DNA_ID=CAMNT_0013951887 /DNA_START=125 /DNA_END=773 /DNA_ORIENTATION=+
MGAKVINLVCGAMQRYALPWSWKLHEEACLVLENVRYLIGVSMLTPVAQDVIALVVTGLDHDSSPRNAGYESTLTAISSCGAYLSARGVRDERTTWQQSPAAGGVNAVLKAMHWHGASVQVCEKACLTLAYLAPHEQNSAYIRKSCGIKLVLSVFAQHHGEMQAQTHALALPANLIVGFPHMQANFRKQKVLGVALNASLNYKNTRAAKKNLQDP